MNGQFAGLTEMGLPKNSVGLGLRSAHIDQILQQRPMVPWFEVLMDNHMAQGGLVPDQLAIGWSCLEEKMWISCSVNNTM